MMFGAMGNRDHDECIGMIHKALDAGVNFIDTADAYSGGESEEIVGAALKDRRDRVVLATKFFIPMGQDPNMKGGSRKWIIEEVESSLRRLGTDYIDLYQIHRWDDATDIEETLSALTDLVRQGKVRNRIVDVPGRSHCRVAVDGRENGLPTFSLRTALVFDLLSRH